MRNKILTALVFSLILSPVLANDGWEDFSNVDKAWDGQQSITNKEFNEVLDALEANKNKKKEKQRKKLIKKIGGGGTSIHKDLSPDSEIKILDPIKKNEDGEILNIPVSLIIDDVILEKGFYKVLVEKDKNGEIFMSFYQAHDFKGKVKAFETDEDYDQETIDFVDFLPVNDKFIKIIFGSLDYNAYSYIKYQE